MTVGEGKWVQNGCVLINVLRIIRNSRLLAMKGRPFKHGHGRCIDLARLIHGF